MTNIFLQHLKERSHTEVRDDYCGTEHERGRVASPGVVSRENQAFCPQRQPVPGCVLAVKDSVRRALKCPTCFYRLSRPLPDCR